MVASVESNTLFEELSSRASQLGMDISSTELALFAEENNIGSDELEVVAKLFDKIIDKRRQTTIQTMLRLSRLPQNNPKTFDNFDFSRIQGRDAKALKKLPDLNNLYARKNISFIGPCGIGKTHLAQAYGRQCCLKGYKTYYVKASELKARMEKAINTGGNVTRIVNTLVKPSCLIIDEIGRCHFDRGCTNLFFDVIDRRYEKEGPNTLILTSNIPANNWNEHFTGDDSLLCTLDRIFDRATVFMIKGPSYRGKELETLSVEAIAQTSKVK